MNFSELNHPLGLRCLPLSYTQYAKLAYESFVDKNTLVFLDTNILGLPFRFHGEARKGFFGLLAIALQEKRLYIPAWASNEFFHRAFRSASNGDHGFGRSAELINKLPKREKVMGLLGKIASEDDLKKVASTIGSTHADALEKIGDLAHTWNDAVSKIGADLNPEMIHEELLEEFNDCFLPLDYNQHCALVDEHADRRRANRIPPGLTDGAKGDADRRGRDAGNVDGDLALWLEILGNAERLSIAEAEQDDGGSKFSCVLVLTEEKKEDFSYAPKIRRVDDGVKVKTTVTNVDPRILLADPRLVSEFESRLKHRNVAFVNIESLAQGWQIINKSAPGGNDIRAFARALMQQIDTESTKHAEREDVKESSTPTTKDNVVDEGKSGSNEGTTGSVSDQPPGDEKLHIPEAAANDEKNFIDGLAATPSVNIIHALNSHNWYVQNPAVLELIRQGVPGDIGIAFVTGRALYQAAHGNAWRADSYIDKFQEICVTAHDSEQALLAGMAYEALFDGRGTRRKNPKSRNIHHIFGILCLARWKPAREWIIRQMDTSGTKYYWKPGAPYPQIGVELHGSYRGSVFDVEYATLKASGFFDVELFRSQRPHSGDTLHVIDNMDELLDWISEHTLVPAESLKIMPSGITKLELHSDPDQDALAIYRARRSI